MIYKGYIGQAVFDEEEKTIRGRVVNLRRDGINFESVRADEVEEEFRTSVDEYLSFCREQNREPEAPVAFEEQRAARTDWESAFRVDIQVAEAAIHAAETAELLAQLTAKLNHKPPAVGMYATREEAVEAARRIMRLAEEPAVEYQRRATPVQTDVELSRS